jgi:hypothetical protein
MLVLTSRYNSDVSLSIITVIFRTYLLDQSMDHLASTLKKGGIKDLLTFFPPQKQDAKALEAHFKAEGLTPVADWFTKKQFAVIKEGLVNGLKQRCEQEDSVADVAVQSRWLII